MSNSRKLMMGAAGSSGGGGAELYGWGRNYQNGVGNNSDDSVSSPVQIGDDVSDWSNVFKGTAYGGYAVTDSYELYGWGQNNVGQLGLGDTDIRSVPTQIGSLTNWGRVVGTVVGGALAVKTDNTAWSWGSGSSGQNGRGNTTAASSPIQIGSLTTWESINGGYGVLGITTGGTLFGWGANNYGQTGSGDTTVRSSPVQVGALTTWHTASITGEHAI